MQGLLLSVDVSNSNIVLPAFFNRFVICYTLLIIFKQNDYLTFHMLTPLEAQTRIRDKRSCYEAFVRNKYYMPPYKN